MDQQAAINQLREKLESLLSQHESFKSQILNLKNEVEKLSPPGQPKKIGDGFPVSPIPEEIFEAAKEEKVIERKEPVPANPESTIDSQPFDLEQYIGGNLINKVGIVILLIGLA